MPKSTAEHEAVIQFRAPERFKRTFEAAAKAQRLSLSAWLRLAALEKAERDGQRKAGR